MTASRLGPWLSIAQDKPRPYLTPKLERGFAGHTPVPSKSPTFLQQGPVAPWRPGTYAVLYWLRRFRSGHCAVPRPAGARGRSAHRRGVRAWLTGGPTRSPVDRGALEAWIRPPVGLPRGSCPTPIRRSGPPGGVLMRPSRTTPVRTPAAWLEVSGRHGVSKIRWLRSRGESRQCPMPTTPTHS
jgi:hypothetical protein